MPRNRDMYQIYYSILEIAKKPRTPARIFRRELTSYPKVKDCVLKLRDCGLIAKTDGKYRTTAKGLTYCSMLERLYQMLPWLEIDMDLDF